MIITMAEVVKRTQDLLGDPTGSQFDKGYLESTINQRYDDMIVELDALDLSYEESVVEINPFAANTADLSVQLAAGGSLESLMVPELIEWKLVGQADTEYVEAEKRDKVLDVAPGTEGIASWEWRGGNIYVSKSSADVVLRVRFQAMSTNIVDATDNVIRGVTNILAYKTAALVSRKRGGDGGAKLAMSYEGMGREAMDNFTVLMVKNAQKQTRKAGRFSRTLRGTRFVAR